MHIGEYCNNIAIGVRESTFSVTLFNRIYDKSKVFVMIELNNLDSMCKEYYKNVS
jgi:hypothetical protein